MIIININLKNEYFLVHRQIKNHTVIVSTILLYSKSIFNLIFTSNWRGGENVYNTFIHIILHLYEKIT